MQKYAMAVSYIGTNFFGWQVQKNKKTIEGELVKALSKVANQDIQLTCAGRTDAGVHALMQVVHFVSDSQRSLDNWQRGVNSYLPSEISVVWVREVCCDFSARFSAISRKYVYIIDNNIEPCLLLQEKSLSYKKFLDVKLMLEASKFLIGEHDFSAFRASKCQSNTPIREIFSIDIEKRNGLVVVAIEANAFLYHMVRNIMGVLLLVGASKKPVDWVRDVLLSKNRSFADKTIFAGGLYLYQVNYPKKYNLPAFGKKFVSIGDLYVC
jgi:tRNA pseudouridine(38-40) synthase